MDASPGVGSVLGPPRAACRKAAAARITRRTSRCLRLCSQIGVQTLTALTASGLPAWVAADWRRPSDFIQGLCIYLSQEACVFSAERAESSLPGRTIHRQAIRMCRRARPRGCRCLPVSRQTGCNLAFPGTANPHQSSMTSDFSRGSGNRLSEEETDVSMCESLGSGANPWTQVRISGLGCEPLAQGGDRHLSH